MKIRADTTLLKRWRMLPFVSYLLIASILLPIAPVSSASYYSNIQSYLLQLANEEPDLLVTAIVQGNIEYSELQPLVSALDGEITKNLSIIHAFAIQMPVGNIKQLASQPTISWISMDAPVSKSADPEAVAIRSDFGRSGVTNSSGWLRSSSIPNQQWTELGESDGPNNGDVALVQFLGGAYDGVRFQGNEKGLSTEMNLWGAADAKLEIAYRRKDFAVDSSCVVIAVSTDNSATWNNIKQICGPATDAELQIESVDLSQFVGGKISIKFETNATFDSNGRFYINYATVVFTPDTEAHEQEGEQDNGADGQASPYQVYLPMVANTGNGTVAVENSQSGEISAAQTESLNYVSEEFNSFSWNNNNGREDWSSSWIEVDPETMAGGPGLGAVRITGGALRFDDNPDSGGEPSAAREVDLRHDIASARLSFSFWTSSKVIESDAAVVEISNDDGRTYTILETFTGISGAVSELRNYDLSSYLPARLLIRFRISDNYDGRSSFFYVDDVRVDYDKVSAGSGWVVLVADSSEWLYQNDIAKIDSTWKNPEFDDSKWILGQGELGYGDGDETTVINEQKTLPTLQSALFRRRFSVADASSFGKLTLSFLKDDGAVFYLNGNELYRSNMPTGAIDLLTPALVAIDGREESRWTSLELPASLLVTGENVLAVELHQAQLDTSDLSFDMELGGYTSCIDCINSVALKNPAVKSIKADQLWNTSKRLQGQSIGVAIVDSGISRNHDNYGALESSRVVKHVNFASKSKSVDDAYGHGSHVAGTIGGNGDGSAGAYIGVAPKVNMIDVKVTDDSGTGSTSDVVAGLDWIYKNREKYNIRVVNLSLNSAIAESYHTSPLDAALEVLWFNKVVVVVSAGNNGITEKGIIYPPANDPFVITVGATDDKGTTEIADDDIASFSAFGKSIEGFAKPEIVAPGRNVISIYASDDCNICLSHPNNVVYSTNGNRYLRISGTSMASAVAAGAVALLLQNEPTLTPDQVKYRLMFTANQQWQGYSAESAGAGYLDISAAVNAKTTESANTGIAASKLLWTGSSETVWSSINWNSVNWNSVNWNSINWNSINWNSINWNSVSWE